MRDPENEADVDTKGLKRAIEIEVEKALQLWDDDDRKFVVELGPDFNALGSKQKYNTKSSQSPLLMKKQASDIIADEEDLAEEDRMRDFDFDGSMIFSL